MGAQARRTLGQKIQDSGELPPLKGALVCAGGRIGEGLWQGQPVGDRISVWAVTETDVGETAGWGDKGQEGQGCSALSITESETGQPQV